MFVRNMFAIVKMVSSCVVLLVIVRESADFFVFIRLQV